MTAAAVLVPSLLVPSAQASQPGNDGANQPAAAGGELALLLPSGSDNSAPAPAPSPETSPAPAPVQNNPAPSPAPPAQASQSHMIRWVYMVGGQLPDGVARHPEEVDVLSPAWFHLDANGNIYGDDIPSVTQFAKAHGIKIVPLVDNDQFDPDSAHSVIANGTSTTQALNSLTSLVNTYGYDGINIDFENLYNADRDLFSGFMSNVYARIHREVGRMVTMAIGSKTQQTYDGFAGMYDYAALAPNFDLAVIMTYDQHYAGGDPGPVASLQWVNDVINYATKIIPPNKLLLGLPFYGYNWNVSTGGWGRAMSYADIVQTVFAHGPGIQMDTASQTPVYVYDSGTGVHQIWFENSTSLAAKLGVAARYGLAGWGAWRGGMEDQNFWSLNLSPAAS